MHHNEGFEFPPHLFTQLSCIERMPKSSGDTSALLQLWEFKKYIKQYSNSDFSISFDPL